MRAFSVKENRTRAAGVGLTVLLIGAAVIGGLDSASAAGSTPVPVSTGAPTSTATPAPTPTPTPSASAPSTVPPEAPAAQPLETTVTITTPSPLSYGTPVVLSATVQDASGKPGVGTVQFTIMGGTTFQVPQTLVDGAAQIVFGSTSFGPEPGQETVHPYFQLPPGFDIGASFLPADSAAQAPSSSVADLAITPATPTVSAGWGGDVVSAPVGGAIEVKAAVSSPPTGESYPLLDPTGTVTFLVGGVAVATVPLVYDPANPRGYSGASALVTSTVAGSPELEAVYSGDANYLGATSGAFPGPLFTATATATATAIRSPQLASTGADGAAALVPGSAAAILVLGGLVLLALRRRARALRS